MPAASGKILVIRGGAIGDFILTLPVLAALRERFPGIRIELLAYPRVGQLASMAGLVDSVQPIDARPMASFFARGGPLPGPLSEFFGSFSVIFSYLFDPDGIFQENVARSSKAQFIAGPHRPNETETLHAADVFLKPLQRLAIYDADPVPKLKLPPPPPSSTEPDSNLGVGKTRWLALHPGSGSERKNWPEEKWALLLQQLSTASNLHFLLVGGEAEGQRLDRLSRFSAPGRFRIARNLPLPDLAQLLGECWGYIGHDSGITHLAAAVGVRALILWPETRLEIWRPRNEQVTILAGPESISELAVEKVLATVRLWK